MAKSASALFLLTVTSFCAQLLYAQKPAQQKVDAIQDARSSAPVPGKKRLDAEGEPLPTGALARLGSTCWRHGSGILCSTLSADGKRLATISAHSVAVWDMATGKVLFRFPLLDRKERSELGYYAGLNILAFSPDGKKLGIAFTETFTGVWDLEKGGEFRRFTREGIGNSSGFCRFTGDGKWFILSYQDCFRFWNPVTGNLHHQIPASFVVNDISADARMCLQFGSDFDNKVFYNLRDFHTGNIIKKYDVLTGHSNMVFAPDCKSLALIDELKKEIQILDLPGSSVRCSFRLPEFAGFDGKLLVYKYHVHFTADSKVLMLANAKGQIHRWDLTTKKELPVLASYPQKIVGLHDLPDGKTLVVTGADGLIHRFDTTTNREISDLRNYQGSATAAVSPDGRLAAVGDSRGRVDLWDLSAVKLLRTLRRDGSPVLSLVFTANSKTLAAGLESETVQFYDVATGRETRSIAFKNTDPKGAWTNPFSTLLFNQDERFLCISNSASELLMWDLARDQVCWRATGDFLSGLPVAFSPSGKTLAFVSQRTEKLLFDPMTGSTKTIGALPKEALLLDPMTGQKRHAIKLVVPRNQVVARLAFSPDGRSLAVAMSDGTISLLNLNTGKEEKRLLTGDFPGVMAFSPDGRTVAVGVMDSVCLWDATTEKMVLRLEGHGDSVNSIAFSPDGHTLLSSGGDSQVYLWSLN